MISQSFVGEGTLSRLVSVLLNEKNEKKSDKDTKLDVLNIFANVANGNRQAVGEVRSALANINEWFDDYIASEESQPGKVCSIPCFRFPPPVLVTLIERYPTGTGVAQSYGVTASSLLGVQTKNRGCS